MSIVHFNFENTSSSRIKFDASEEDIYQDNDQNIDEENDQNINEILKEHFLHADFMQKAFQDVQDPDMMDDACQFGDIHVVLFLHSVGAPRTKYSFDAAAKNGHLAVVSFLHQRCNENGTRNALIGACIMNHQVIVEYLCDNDLVQSEGTFELAMKNAIKNNHIKIIEYLYPFCDYFEECLVVSIEIQNVFFIHFFKARVDISFVSIANTMMEEYQSICYPFDNRKL